MSLDFKLIRNTLIVKVKGELDLLIAEKLREEIDRKLIDHQIKNLILNLEKVTFIDSSGLGLIIGRYKKISALNGKMYIVGAKPAIEKILFFSGINKLVPIYRGEQDIINI
ncbi:MAG: anti-sigma F factor antagonist [Syntrophomonadaceae bacterium]|nr:anti-sigma F factor antagonist [Syntrophomonadaceae bacterium]MDD3024206.1 anti-sigma F factor antagonist [Syntrophomonadaceae bacterium]